MIVSESSRTDRGGLLAAQGDKKGELNLKKLYGIGKTIDGYTQLLRDGWETDDAYTDDLGCAELYDSPDDIDLSEDEYIVVVEEDEEGGLTVVDALGVA